MLLNLLLRVEDSPYITKGVGGFLGFRLVISLRIKYYLVIVYLEYGLVEGIVVLREDMIIRYLDV